ncbi:hypothetical protein ACSBR1_034511 [Camellia fascicularis]
MELEQYLNTWLRHIYVLWAVDVYYMHVSVESFPPQKWKFLSKHRLKDFHMTTSDVKNRMIQFPSRYTYDAAIRAINRKACLYKLERYLQRALAKLKDHNNYQAGAASQVNADSQLEEIQQEIHRSMSQLEEMEKRLKYLALP